VTESNVFNGLRAALKKAQVGTDGELEFAEASETVGIMVIKQLHASYRAGEEYMRLDTLLEELRTLGTVKVFEFRGHRAGAEPRLVADIDIAGERFQVIYHLA
jgi:hypothetical protein